MYRVFFPPGDDAESKGEPTATEEKNKSEVESADETPELPEVPTTEPIEAGQPEPKKRKVEEDNKKEE